MEETVRHRALRPAPGRESPDVDGAHRRQGGPAPLLDRVFGRDDITVLRHELSRVLTPAMLGDRLDGFILAVNEVITNVVLHAGGNGRLMLEAGPASVCCTVTDSGPGIPERFRRPPEMPEAFDVGGRGIWLAYRLCDEVSMATGPIGTTIGLKILRPAG